VKLRRFIAIPGRKLDCADATVACTLSSQSEGAVDVETPLVFTKSAGAGAAADAAATVVRVGLGDRPGGVRGSADVAACRASSGRHPAPSGRACALWRSTLRG